MAAPVSKFVSTIRIVDGRFGYVRQDKFDSCLEPFVLGKLDQVLLHVILRIFGPVNFSLIHFASTACLSCDELDGRGA